MARRLFLLFLSGFIGIIGSPEILMASDTFEVMTPGFSAVETVVEEEKTEESTEPSQDSAPVSSPVSTPISRQPQVIRSQVSVAPVVRNYTVTIFTDKMIAENLSYYDLYKFRKLVYGHNSPNLLGNLSSLSENDIFTITEHGVVKNYRVAQKVTYTKTADGYLEGDSRLMARVASAMGHDVALMTCAGVSYGNGDASQRLVIYADAI